MFACQTCVPGFYLGQIELYTHIPVMRMLVDQLRNWDFRVCGVFLLDAQFMIQVRQCKVELWAHFIASFAFSAQCYTVKPALVNHFSERTIPNKCPAFAMFCVKTGSCTSVTRWTWFVTFVTGAALSFACIKPLIYAQCFRWSTGVEVCFGDNVRFVYNGKLGNCSHQRHDEARSTWQAG